jgi:hypothetical protein
MWVCLLLLATASTLAHAADTKTTTPAPAAPTPAPIDDPHQTTMVIIFVLCGAFAWLCIVKSCCALCGKKGDYGEHGSARERTRSAHEANQLWDAIRKTPPPKRLSLAKDGEEARGILRRGSYHAPEVPEITGDGRGGGGDGVGVERLPLTLVPPPSDEGGSTSSGASTPMAITPPSLNRGVSFSRTNRAKSIEGSSYQEHMLGLIPSNPSSLSSDHGVLGARDRLGSDSSSCSGSVELSPKFGGRFPGGARHGSAHHGSPQQPSVTEETLEEGRGSYDG